MAPRQSAEPQVASALSPPGVRHHNYSSSTMPHPRRAAAANSHNQSQGSTFNARGHHKLQHSQSQRYSVNYQEEMRRQAYIQSLGECFGGPNLKVCPWASGFLSSMR